MIITLTILYVPATLKKLSAISDRERLARPFKRFVTCRRDVSTNTRVLLGERIEKKYELKTGKIAGMAIKNTARPYVAVVTNSF